MISLINLFSGDMHHWQIISAILWVKKRVKYFFRIEIVLFLHH